MIGEAFVNAVGAWLDARLELLAQWFAKHFPILIGFWDMGLFGWTVVAVGTVYGFLLGNPQIGARGALIFTASGAFLFFLGRLVT